MPKAYINQFSGLTHLDALPLAAGLVVSAAKTSPVVAKHFELEIVVERWELERTLARYYDPALLAFSCYPWNTRYSLEVARQAKTRFPDCLVVCGGPTVPRESGAIERYFQRHEHVDILVLGEGELTFRELLETEAMGGDLSEVAGIAHRDANGAPGFQVSPPRPRLEDFASTPSPYLDGVFDALLDRLGAVFSAALLETNRGCPFSCAFCDWGQATQSRVHDLPLERITGELEWIAEHGIPYIYVVDANFGIRSRDRDIAQFVADLKRRRGLPQYFFFHLRKNARERDLAMVEALLDAEVGCQVALSTQDFDDAVLSAVTRSNIKPERSRQLRRACNDRQIPTYNELLLGLPEQTFESFCDSVVEAISPYPSDTFFLYPTRLVENAALSSSEYRADYAIETRMCRMASVNPMQREHHVPELEEIVVATSAMPLDDWRRAVAFGYLAVASYNLALLDTVIRYLLVVAGADLKGYFQALGEGVASASDDSGLGHVRAVIDGYTSSILSGGPLFVEMNDGHHTHLRVADAIACAALERADGFFAEVYALSRAYLASVETESSPERDSEAILEDLFRFQRFATPTIDRQAAEQATFEHDWLSFRTSLERQPVLERKPTTIKYEPPAYVLGAATFEQFALVHLADTYAKRGDGCLDHVHG